MSKQKWSSLLFAVIVLILTTIYGDQFITPLEPSGTATPAGTYEVVKVVDGDTITILKDGEKVSVRLIGVDTPETVDPRQAVECFGDAATAEVERLVAGKAVRIETDASQGERDTYGRLLAYVYAGDVLVNEHLIAQGFGHEYTFIKPYVHQRDFRAAETEARDAQKGLWAPGVCTDVR